MGQIVDVNDLSRSFGGKSALDGVSFRATAGQVYGLVGANGAGKTTLLKHLLGLLRATTGSVRVFGLDPVRDPVGVLSRVGYLSEERELPEWMRVDELMRYTQAFHPTWDASYARELLESFALDPSKKVKELSKGMRAQAGLIAAVAHRPELLILDEPSSGLDAVVRRDILDAIVRTVADDGRTVIFSSHLLDEVERMSDHVTLMHHGRVTLSGALDDVRRGYQRSRVRFVEHFDQPPVLDTALAMEGGGRTWSVVHSGSLEQFHHSVLALGGEVVESRDATLEEIFLARAGREPPASGGGMMLQTAYPGRVSRQRSSTWTHLSPILAMLWENWRLTRGEAAWRLSLGLVGGSAALALSDSGATIAVWVLLSQHGIFWMSIAKLTGGRFIDGYRPGFPLHLLYTRPVRTSVIVGVAMGYDAVSGAAMYVASAALLGFAFGQTLPVLSMAVLIVVFHMVCTFVQWSTRSRVLQWLGSFGIWGLVVALFTIRGGGSPLQLDFSFAETALMASIGLVSFALTVAGVARQRRGDARAAIPRTKGSGAADWFAGLFRFPCPTSSPTRRRCGST